jgi:PTS system nitrogen regulatory IIA component
LEIAGLLDRKAILPRAAAGSKRHVLSVIAETAARIYRLDPAEAVSAIMAREARGSTGVGFGVALPHARVSGLDRVRGVFARLEAPLPFDAVDDQPVDLVFALFTPDGPQTDHLRALARISRVLRQGELREQLRQARTTDAIYALLAQEERQGAAA